MDENAQLSLQPEIDTEEQPQSKPETLYSITSEDGETLTLTLEELKEIAVKGMLYDKLKEQIEIKQREKEKEERELKEFKQLFPNDDACNAAKNPETLKFMDKGYSLAVAHALTVAAASEVKNVNDNNSRRSTGSAGNCPEREMLLSDEQIAGMSINEMKEKWPFIMASIKRKKG